MAPGADTASNRNEYQVYFLEGKGGRCVRLTTLPPYCAVVMKSGNLNFLEPSGPLQACNGTALPCFNTYRRQSLRIAVKIDILIACMDVVTVYSNKHV